MPVIIEARVDPSLAALPTAIDIIAQGVNSGTRAINRQVLDNMYSTASSVFENSIVRPATSVTAGGQSYRAGERATGNFTFGDGETFQGRLSGTGRRQEILFPIVSVADNRTDRAWRPLEFGTGPFQMPGGYWRDVSGNRVEPGEGFDDQFFPGRGDKLRASGITGKFFLTTAIEGAIEQLERAYEQLADDLSDLVVEHGIPGTARYEEYTLYRTQQVSGYTTKKGRTVAPYTRQVPVDTVVNRVFTPLDF